MAAVSVEAIAWAPNLAPAPTDRARPSSPCCFVLAGLANHAGPVLAARLSSAQLPAPPEMAVRPPWCGRCEERTRMLGFDGHAPAPPPRCKRRRRRSPHPA
jgi:hypothetical protein